MKKMLPFIFFILIVETMESLERETNAQIHALTNQFSQQVFKSFWFFHSNLSFLTMNPLFFSSPWLLPYGALLIFS